MGAGSGQVNALKNYGYVATAAEFGEVFGESRASGIGGTGAVEYQEKPPLNRGVWSCQNREHRYGWDWRRVEGGRVR